MSKDETPPALTPVAGGDVFLLRDKRVMLDARVAEAFGTETKRVNEAVSRNAEKFDETHTFQLTDAETEELRTNSSALKPPRGGARYNPHVFTIKGVARLATILNSPAALRATDLIIDTFLTVHEQLRRGRRTVAMPEPERYRVSSEAAKDSAKLRAKLTSALSRLLDTIVDVETQASVRQVGQSLSSASLHHIHERLRAKGLENSKLEADTGLVLAQAEKTLAEARKARSEADGLDIANFERRISAVKKISELIREVEPTEVIGLIDAFEAEPLKLPKPAKD